VFSKATARGMNIIPKGNRIDTTLGDLIAAVGDAALENSDDPKEAYYLARLVLAEIFKRASLGAEFAGRYVPTTRYLH
jgi:hypothetical protein